MANEVLVRVYMGRAFQFCGVFILFRHYYFVVLQFAIARAQANKTQHHVHFVSLNSLHLNGQTFRLTHRIEGKITLKECLLELLLNGNTLGIRPKN